MADFIDTLYSHQRLRLLVVSDVDILSASRLAEHFVPMPPQFDCCIVCGPFIHSEIATREDEAVAEGDMASAIAQLENIVCRVVYLPSVKDPPTTLVDQLHLTPNSVCIHARMMLLTTGLYIAGLTEKGETLPQSANESVDGGNEDGNAYDVESSSAVSIIHEVLQSIIDVSVNIDLSGKLSQLESTSASSVNISHSEDSPHASILPMTIFLLNYKFAHTLSQFIFNSTSLLENAGVGLCIAPTSMTNPPDIPPRIGKVVFTVPKSLRLGHYIAVELILLEQKDSLPRWTVSTVENHTLPQNNGL